MIANRAWHVLKALPAIILVGFVCGCSATESSHSPSTPPSPSASAPSDEEIAAAVKQLFPPESRGVFELSPEPEDVWKCGTIVIGPVQQDASGRWLATVCLEPPMMASSCPVVVVMARDAGNWQVLSEKQGRLDSTVPSSGLLGVPPDNSG